MNSHFKSSMSRMTCKSHKFLRSIIILFSKMMNNFFGSKVSTYLSFYYKSSFTYIVIKSTTRMVRSINHFISAFINIASTFPIRTLFSNKIFIFIYTTTLNRAILSMTRKMSNKFLLTKLAYNNFLITSSAFYRTICLCIFSARINIGIFLANLTFSIKTFFLYYTSIIYYFRHKYLQLKRALFGGLSRTVKSLHLLRAQVVDIKNLFLISIYSISQNALNVNNKRSFA